MYATLKTNLVRLARLREAVEQQRRISAPGEYTTLVRLQQLILIIKKRLSEAAHREFRRHSNVITLRHTPRLVPVRSQGARPVMRRHIAPR